MFATFDAREARIQRVPRVHLHIFAFSTYLGIHYTYVCKFEIDSCLNIGAQDMVLKISFDGKMS